jgi:hypothetical protein
VNPRADWTLYGAVGALALVAVSIVLLPILLFQPGAATGPADPNAPVVGPTPPFGPGQPGVPQDPGSLDSPPQFVATGARLTWYAAAASVANSRFSWVEEPCTGNNWTDPKTGKCYRRTDESGEGQGTASGDGLSQLDIVALDGSRAAISNTLYTFFRENNTLIWTPVGGASVSAIDVDGAWIHPARLAQIAQSGLGDLLVLRGRYSLGTQTFDALSAVSGLGTSTYSSYTYDLATGILLSANTSTGGITSPLSAPGQGAPTSNSQLTMARFAGFRTRNLPGMTAPKPDWVNGTSQLIYQGTYNFTNPVDPSSANLTYPTQVTVQLGQGGATWSSFTSRTETPALNINTQSQGVAGPNGPYWYDPASLAGMSAGQVLDQDGLTGERTTVSAVGQDQAGTAVVSIDVQLPGNFARFTYEQSTGMLVEFTIQAANAGTTTTARLVERR